MELAMEIALLKINDRNKKHAINFSWESFKA